MNIRPAVQKDLDIIMKIEESSFIPEIQEERSVFSKRIEICPSLFLIFCDGDEEVGYISAELMSQMPGKAEDLKLGHEPEILSDQFAEKKFYIYISSFALFPSARGNGNGKKCWKLALDYFKNHFNPKAFLLLVNEEWKGAYHIYEQSGFSEVTVFEDFFSSSVSGKSNGILMQNLLN